MNAGQEHGAVASETVCLFELYKFYCETAEKVSDRRAAGNTWLLSINSAIIALYGLLHEAGLADAIGGPVLWTVAIPIAGAITCVSWLQILTSYNQLNTAKFKVLHEIEHHLPIKPFQREEEFHDQLSRQPLSRIERGIPVAFLLLHILFFGAAIYVVLA